MADNVELDVGSGGAKIATDDDGTAQHQYTKVEFGPDNTQTKVTTTSGLPVQNDNTDLKITLDSEAVVLGTGSAAIGKLAANSGVDIGDVTLNAGTAEIGKLAAGTAEIGKLAAGTAAIGKLAANSGVDIGDVDVTSLPGSISGPAEPSIDSYTHKAINLTTGADQVLASSSANKQIWVYAYHFMCGDADAQSVSFQDEDDVALSGIMEFAQYGGATISPSGNFSMPIWKLGTNKDLEVDILGGDVDGWITYAIVSV
ncbi:hypothetical protein LCGC14_2361840 [marine sediment metagenome]|uniref:Uncharacterized protein n=1 Tax=marine sediment metagenome TaxID=412755 RepID=A0A0F9F197_9ZZZZ